jgi:diamine N-acetyltransferase
MDDSSLQRLESADLAAVLKSTVAQLLEAFEQFKPFLHRRIKRRLSLLFDSLVTEVIDAETPVLWWEMTLDLAAKEARQKGEAGLSLLQAIQAALPLLQVHFGDPGAVALLPVTEETFVGICLLSDTLSEPQSLMVAPNVFSLAQAHFNPYARFWAIYAGKTPVGFMMIADDDQTPEYFLWRLMIGEPFQGRGYGRLAINCLVEYLRTRPGAAELLVSCEQGDGSPEGFYLRLGFTPTGDLLGDEIILKMSLSSPGS